MEAKLTLKQDKKVINSAKKDEYPLLIKRLSGIISEDDLRKLSQHDGRVIHILREEV
jgi:hypothetical protein